MKKKKQVSCKGLAEIDIKQYLKDGDIIKGFFLVNMMKGLPNLQHFFLFKEYRNLDNVRAMIMGMFVPSVKDLGFDKAYLHARTYRQAKLIKYFFGKEPYAIEQSIAWFLVDL
jgi:hypothetical protein